MELKNPILGFKSVLFDILSLSWPCFIFWSKTSEGGEKPGRLHVLGSNETPAEVGTHLHGGQKRWAGSREVAGGRCALGMMIIWLRFLFPFLGRAYSMSMGISGKHTCLISFCLA